MQPSVLGARRVGLSAQPLSPRLCTRSFSNRRRLPASPAHFTPSFPTSSLRPAAQLDAGFFSSHIPPHRTGRSLSTAPRNSQLRMLLVGSPGSGKGTQSTRLLREYDLTVISAGDLLRSHIERRTEIGTLAQGVIRAGGLMPDHLMMQIVGDSIRSLGSRDWILDGFPRTDGQAEMLDSMLDGMDKRLNLVINLDVPEEVILDRILQRWTHLPSGRVYNLSFNPPKVAGKDDITGEPLVQREDDNVETFANRLAAFHKQTEPMLQRYRHQAQATTGLLDIDAKSNAPSEKTKGLGTELYVNLRGDESKQIWPHLFQIVSERYPDLPKAKPQAE